MNSVSLIKESPLISVIMPVYNAAPYIRQAIDSILNQSYANFEFIIIDDGSTDKSISIIQSFQDSRIRFFRNDLNLKIVETLNRGLSLAKGKYIARMDADDVAMPERLHKQVAFMEENLDIGLCGTWYENIGDKQGVVKLATDHDEIVFRLLVHFEMLHPSWLIRSSLIQKYGLKYELLYGEDYHFLFKMLPFTKIANLPEVQMKYRQFDSSMSKSNWNKTEENCRTVRRNIFALLGLKKVSDRQLLFFKKCYYQDYSFSKSDLNELNIFFQEIINLSSRQKIISPSFLKSKIGYLMENACYHAKCTTILDLPMFYKSPIVKNYRPTISSSRFFLKKLAQLVALKKFSNLGKKD